MFAVCAFFVVVWQESDDDAGPPAAAARAREEENTPSDVLHEVLLAMAFAAPLGLGLAVGGAAWITSRALRPLDDVIGAARTMTVADLGRRLPVPPGDDELARLVATLNQLFARLEHGRADLERFADDASHELRTPLSVVASELEIALRRPRSAGEWETTARTSLEEVRRLARLVHAMLRLARAEPLHSVEPIELARLVDRAIASRAVLPEASQPPVVERRPAAASWVDGDAEALAVAVSNLLDNAVRHAAAGGRVVISLERKNGHILVHFDDSGPGVPPSRRDAIFAPYARGDGAHRDGAGLGLAIARRIAERHDGTLTASDAPGGGARFTLSLPGSGGPSLGQSTGARASTGDRFDRS